MCTYIVPRDGVNETTIAVVTADYNQADKSTVAFLHSLNNAMSQWFDAEQGQIAWVTSCEDFNIGDLANESLGPETPLGQFLAAEGICNMVINTYTSDSHGWSFDMGLGYSEYKDNF